MCLGSKTAIIDRIKRWDLLLWTIFSTKLSGVMRSYVAEVLTMDRTTLELEEFIPPSKSLSYLVVRELNPGKRMSRLLMNHIFEMFDRRDHLIGQQYGAQNRKKSKYCSVEFSSYLISQQPIDIAQVKSYFLPQENILLAYRNIYFAFELCELDSWCLIYADFEHKRIYFIDSQRRQLHQLGPYRNVVDNAVNRLNNIVSLLYQENNMLNFNNWQVGIYPHLLFEAQQNDFDSGIIIASTIYFITLKAPVYFNESIVQEARINFAHWLIKDKSLPL